MGIRNEIQADIAIDATPDEVWAVLSDFERYGEWNPGFFAIRGRPVVGTKLEVTFAKDGGKGMTMRPTVLAAEPGRELRWLGRLFGIPALFDGEHRFEIHGDVTGRVRFVQAERFRGLLVPFLRKLIEVETVEMFHRTNQALADRVAQVRGLA